MDSVEQKAIQERALAFAKKNKKLIAKRITDINQFMPEENPVSVFMAGSPGAGKTESSLELLAELSSRRECKILRIDPDELRNEFEEYQGNNSWLFQPAVSILVEKIHDLVLEQQQSFLLDGTLSNYEVARKNIQRSLSKGRIVQILYVYQDPQSAWNFVLAREKKEGRQIKLDTFIEQYFSAREVVNRLKQEFNKTIQIALLLRNNLEGSKRFYWEAIDRIDSYIPEQYNRTELKQILTSI